MSKNTWQNAYEKGTEHKLKLHFERVFFFPRLEGFAAALLQMHLLRTAAKPRMMESNIWLL